MPRPLSACALERMAFSYRNFVAAGILVRDLLVLLASGFGDQDIFMELAIRSPVQALVSGAFAVLLLVVFRQWFAIRLDV